jgi:hypothetical protein
MKVNLKTHHLNVDLDIFACVPLKGLVDAMGEERSCVTSVARRGSTKHTSGDDANHPDSKTRQTW